MHGEGAPRPYDQNETGTPTKPADLKAAEATFSPDAPVNPVITRQRKEEARAEARRNRRTTTILTAAGLAAAAAITFGPREATNSEMTLPDNRQMPERTATMPEASILTPSQAAEKALADAKAADEAAKKMVAELGDQEVPRNILEQDFTGLDTRKID